MSCKLCGGRGQVQGGYAGETLEPCPDCGVCETCHGEGCIDSGGFSPWGAPISLACPDCSREQSTQDAAWGAAWRSDSSLEKWFPFTAEELEKLKQLNEEKFKTIEAYRKAASNDKWEIRQLKQRVEELTEENERLKCQ